MIPSRTPLKLYWQMVDHFAAKPGAWRFFTTYWHIESSSRSTLRAPLRTVLAGSLDHTTWEFTMAAHVSVAGATSVTASRRLMRQLTESGVHERLREHGFRSKEVLLQHFPLSVGPMPAWIAGQRLRLNAQYRDAGHKPEWYRGPREEGVMITSMREDLRGLRDVLRERRVLEGLHLGDPDERGVRGTRPAARPAPRRPR